MSAVYRRPLPIAAGSAAETVTVDAANLTLTGQTIVVVDLEVITPANLSLAGQTVGDVDVTPVDAANLSLAGQTILEIDVVSIDASNLALAGQTIDLVETAGDTVVVDPANLVLAGQDITVTEIEVSVPPAESTIGSGWVPHSLSKKRWLKILAEIRAERAAAERLPALPQKAAKAAIKAVEAAIEVAPPDRVGPIVAEIRQIMADELTSRVMAARLRAAQRQAEILLEQDDEDAITALLFAA